MHNFKFTITYYRIFMKKFFFIALVVANFFQSTTIYSRTNKEKAYSALGIGILVIAITSYFYNRRSSTPIIQPASTPTDSDLPGSALHTPTSTEVDKTEKENRVSYDKENSNSSSQPAERESNTGNKAADSSFSLVKKVKDSFSQA